MTAVERMRKLVYNLPKSDQALGIQFIDNRGFESLQELVDSAIFRTKKNLRSENPRQEYLDVDLSELCNLKAEVDVYVAQLELPSNEDEYEEEY